MQFDRAFDFTQKVLIVDPQTQQSGELVVQLESLGLTTAILPDRAQAEAAIASFLPQVVLLTIALPEEGAYHLCRSLKQNPLTASISVIFLIPTTIEFKASLRQQIFAVGGNDYLLAPWTGEELEARLKLQQPRSLQWLYDLFQEVTDAIAVFDNQYRFVFYNSQFQAEFQSIFGQSPVFQGNVIDLLASLASEQAKARQLLDRALQGEAYTVTEIFGDRHREQRIYELSFAPVFATHNPIAGVSLIARDVTERILAQQQLQNYQNQLEEQAKQRTLELETVYRELESNQRLFRTVTNAAPVLLWITNPQGDRTFVNQPWLEFTNADLDAPLGKGWLDFVHPEDRDRVLKALQNSFESYCILEIEYRLRHKDGSYHWFLDRSQPHFDSEQQFQGYIGCCVEISDRKAAEAALQESEERYRFLFNSGSDLIVVHHFDDNGIPSEFIEVNDIACQVLGYSREELLQRSPHDLVIESSDRDRAEVLRTLFEQGHCLFQRTLQTKDGRYFPVENSSHLFVFRGRTTCLTISRDISDRQLAEEKFQASEERYRLIAKNMTDLVCLHEPDGRYRYLSPSCKTLLGYKPEELLGVDPYTLLHPDDQEKVRRNAHQLNLAGTTTEITHRVRTKTGEYIWLNTATKPILDAAGRVERLLTTSRAVGDRVRAEQALRASEKRLNTIINNTSYGIVIVDNDGIILFVNTAATQIFNRSLEALIGSDLGIPAMTSEPAELEILARRDRIINVEIRIKQIEWDNESVKILSLQDITERKKTEAQLEHRAYYDILTDLPNRTLFMSQLTQALQRLHNQPSFRFAVLFLDLDRFKIVNDSLGHLAGDRLLVSLTQRLQTILRPLDTLARLGGDEFTILLEDIHSLEEVTDVARRINQALQLPLNVEGMSIVTTVSIGITLSHSGYTQPEHLLRDADLAMYRAKEKGRSRYEIFDQEMHSFAVEQLRLEHDLRLAIERGEFLAYYQPIINLHTQAIAGFEGLIRWQHPQQGLIPPDRFIPIAEETGLISVMGEWMLQHSCAQLRTWQTTFPHCEELTMSVNLSSKQLRDAELLTIIDRIITQTEIPSHTLKLELTESMLVDNVTEAIAILDQIRDRGIQLSIDDFGTGYSSLSYLHRFPVNTLKIDKSFVSRMDDRGNNREIVETILALAYQLDLDAIAEGVETQQQLQQLQTLGCQFGQGYYFAPPLSANAVAEFIHQFACGSWFSSPPTD
ncbi:MAG: PAS domain S-box protein [Jaaginema sp. PMC 1079.18]|nr:PAS domain S-box protein [Jaaginema sp. PMC 1080.18]MEC4852464.1 PAS domain S-box protein [Jaaginema sp. PMC 1079.18]MEC4865839.1 PAS domain S-box protein [Jaaginema sp. PMC 1078.18]